MKKLLRYLIIFLILLAIAAIVLMALSPKKLVFEESISIAAPAKMIYNKVNDFKTWESWSPWMEMDPNAEHTYTNKTTGVGAKWSWKGNKEVGEGNQTIVESVDGKSIKTALEFSGWDGQSFSDWNFEADGDKTKVTWGFDGAETPFYLRPFNLLMKSGLISTYKKGLNKIKKLTEEQAKNKVYNGYKMNEIYQGIRHFVMNRQVVDIADVDKVYSQNLGALFTKTQGVKLDMAGMPSALFYSWDEANGKTDMAVAIPVSEPVNVPGAISQTLSDGKAVQVDYMGNYDKLEEAHIAIDAYLKDQGLLVNYPLVQEYMTDPAIEKDQSKWLTKITYYVTSSTQ